MAGRDQHGLLSIESDHSTRGRLITEPIWQCVLDYNARDHTETTRRALTKHSSVVLCVLLLCISAADLNRTLCTFLASKSL
jgi:hypothetical protein